MPGPGGSLLKCRKFTTSVNDILHFVLGAAMKLLDKPSLNSSLAYVGPSICIDLSQKKEYSQLLRRVHGYKNDNPCIVLVSSDYPVSLRRILES